MLALAGKAGDVALSSDLRHSSRSLVSPSEQVGKHSGGGDGWRAAAVSGGIALSRVGGGGKGGGALVQAASNKISSGPSVALALRLA